MRKMLEVLGLPVIDTSSGKKVGIVKDAYFTQAGELKGLAIESDGLFSKISYLDFSNIGAIGDDAVIIGSSQFLTTISSTSELYSFVSGKKSYKELPVITTNGNELGHIQDVYFMEDMGRIIGYEISDGFLSDITDGRRTIKHPQRMILGEDALIIPNTEIKDVMLEGDSV